MKAIRDPRGRKKSGKAVRSQRVQCSMTPEDAEWFNEFAKDCGFVSRSQLITSILERLRLCGFSPSGSLRMASQIQHRLNKRRKSGKAPKDSPGLDWDSLLLRPLPPLPEEAPFDSDEEFKAIEELQHEHQHQHA
jgi:hypothetical protein